MSDLIAMNDVPLNISTMAPEMATLVTRPFAWYADGHDERSIEGKFIGSVRFTRVHVFASSERKVTG